MQQKETLVVDIPTDLTKAKHMEDEVEECSRVRSNRRDKGKVVVSEGTLSQIKCQNGFGLLGILNDPLVFQKKVP